MVRQHTRQKAIYKLGRVIFSVNNCDPAFEQALSQLLPQISCRPPADQILEISTGCEKDVRALFNHILKRHYRCVWIDACCLISPSGQRLLMAGQSASGKSTLTMALALGHQWQVLAEDLVLIDTEHRKVIVLAMPISLKSGAVELLLETISQAPDFLYDGEWYPLGEMAAKEDLEARFDLAVFLTGRASGGDQFSSRAITPFEYLREVIKHSNILRRKGSIDTVAKSLASARCMLVGGGTLLERMNLILTLGQKQAEGGLS